MPLIGICQIFSSSIADTDGVNAVTVWLAGDFDKVSGRKLLINALKHVVRVRTIFSSSLLIKIQRLYEAMLYRVIIFNVF